MCLPQVIKSFQNYRGVATTFYPTLVSFDAHLLNELLETDAEDYMNLCLEIHRDVGR